MIRFTVFIGVAALFLFSSFCESEAVIPVPESGNYILTGRISDTVLMPPACGMFAFATAVEMEIISYSDTSYKHDRIVVVYTCPDFNKDKEYFKIGKIHTFIVQDHNPASFGWIIMDSEKLKENNLPYDLYVIDDGIGGK